MNVLETSRLKLRRLVPEDAEVLFRTAGNADVMRFWAPGPDQNSDQTCARINAINEHWNTHGFGDWALIEKGKDVLIGFCGLHYIAGMNEVNIGYAIEKSKWGLGFGAEIVKKILEIGFHQLGLKKIVAVIDPNNELSLKLIRKCGFTYWKDSSYMGRPRVVYKIGI